MGRHSAGSLAPSAKPPVINLLASDGELLDQVVGFYHDSLPGHEPAMAYLASRGLDADELLKHFRLGFSDRSLGMELPPGRLKAGDKIRRQLQRVGILRGTGHEHFRGSVVVPIVDGTGAIVQIYGRKVGTPGSYKPGTELHTYMTESRGGVWNAEGLGHEVILCKGLVDAMTLWRFGFRSVTAVLGAHGDTADHLAAFEREGVGRVLIAFDSDPAGDQAAMKVAGELLAVGIEPCRVQLPSGEDLNDIACLDLDTAQTRLQRVVERAAPLQAGVPVARHLRTVKTATEAPQAGSAPPIPSVPSVRPSVITDTDTDTETGTVDRSDQDELTLPLGTHLWRVRGLSKASTFDTLRVNVMVRAAEEGPYGDAFHVDTLDLYSARHRAAFVTQAVRELSASDETVRKELGTVLRRCEEAADELARTSTEPVTKPVTISAHDEAEALAFLRDPNLIDRIVEDYEHCGIVGEETNKLVAYLAATSRLLDRPLAVMVQSTSAAGKSALLEATLSFLPEEAQHSYSAMTGRSLFYMAGQDLSHKVLAVAEVEGIEQAAYALKLLQSEGSVSIASTGKDTATGRFITRDYSVSGPVALFLTTTALDVDEELLNRCMVLSVDEERDQTRAIQQHQRQGQTLEGLLADRDRARVRRVHHNAQRLLQPVLVVNPYAHRLSFADERTRTRRDHMKYLSLIRSVALLFQHQREHKVIEHEGETLTYIEVTPEDITLANRLAHEVLGRSLDDLPTQTRRLLVSLREMVARRADAGGTGSADVHFSRREVLRWSGWGATQLAVHLDRLIKEEYVLIHQGGRGKTFVYELLWDGSGSDGTFTLNGLAEPGILPYDGNLPGAEANITTPSRPGLGEFPVLSHSVPSTGNTRQGNEDLATARGGAAQAAPPAPVVDAVIGSA
jgi:DNA primase